MNSDCYMVYTTFPNLDEARALAAKMVEDKLAACANIFPAHEALYEWEGEVHNDSELAVIFKTTKARYADLEAAIIKHHSYDEPCVVAWSLEAGSAPFLQWIENQTKSVA